jgi:hypothetical protein
MFLCKYLKTVIKFLRRRSVPYSILVLHVAAGLVTTSVVLVSPHHTFYHINGGNPSYALMFMYTKDVGTVFFVEGW